MVQEQNWWGARLHEEMLQGVLHRHPQENLKVCQVHLWPLLGDEWEAWKKDQWDVEWNDWRGQQQREGMVGFNPGLGDVGQVQPPIIIGSTSEAGTEVTLEMTGLHSFLAPSELICSDTPTMTTFLVWPLIIILYGLTNLAYTLLERGWYPFTTVAAT